MLRRSRVPMTAHGVGPSTRPTENWQHRLLHRTSTSTESARLRESAYRNRVENNIRRNRNEKTKTPTKEKQRRGIDIGDLLIENPVSRELAISMVGRTLPLSRLSGINLAR